MSGRSQQFAKDRSSNFNLEETSKLMLLLKDHPIITCKKTDHTSNQQKEAAWKLVLDKFNSDTKKYRSLKQLQQKYNNMKKTARKEMATEKYGRRQTGGGPPPPKPSDTTEWLNSIMGESISGLPAIYDSDALDNTLVDVVPIDPLDVDTTVNVNLDLSKKNLDEKYTPQASDIVISESEDFIKENVPNNNEGTSEFDKFDSSTPRAMLRKPISKELCFNTKTRKSLFTPLETRKSIISHVEKKKLVLSQKQLRDTYLAQYAKEEHEQNLKQKKELHDLEVDFKKNMYRLMIEKTKFELETAKLEFNKQQH